jgi:hypothetical protein
MATPGRILQRPIPKNEPTDEHRFTQIKSKKRNVLFRNYLLLRFRFFHQCLSVVKNRAGGRHAYFNFAYSVLASRRMGMSESAPFQSAKKS